MRTKRDSPELAIVARGLALLLVDFSFPPDAEHTPGVGHAFADKLSRVFSNGGKGVLTPVLHPAMSTAHVVTAPACDKSFYKL